MGKNSKKPVKPQKSEKDNMREIIQDLNHVSKEEMDENERRIKLALKKLQEYLKEVAKIYRADNKTDNDIVNEFLERYKEDIGQEVTSKQVNEGFGKHISACNLLADLISFNGDVLKVMKTPRRNAFEVEILNQYLDMKKAEQTQGERLEVNPQDLAQFLSGYKNDRFREQKEYMLERVKFLEEYGFLDEIIDTANGSLVEMGMDGLEYQKRVEPADSYYFDFINEKGEVEWTKKKIRGKQIPLSIVKGLNDDTSDITSSKYNDEVSAMQIADREIGVLNIGRYIEGLDDFGILLAMQLYWDNKYNWARENLSEALQIADYMNLWEVLINGSKEDIDNLDSNTIATMLKGIVLLRIINTEDSGEELQQVFDEFLIKQGLDPSNLAEDKKKVQYYDDKNLYEMDIYNKGLAITFINSLQNKKDRNVECREWGKVNTEGEEVTIAVDFDELRAPILFSVYKDDLNATLPGFKDKEYAKSLYSTTGIPLPITDAFVAAVQNANLPQGSVKERIEQKVRVHESKKDKVKQKDER